jgi:hypothetical protein
MVSPDLLTALIFAGVISKFARAVAASVAPVPPEFTSNGFVSVE